MKLRSWETLSSHTILDSEPWFSVSMEQVKLPDGRLIENYHRIDMPDYVLIFAQTTNDEVLVERQYKHGVQKVSLTLPAGGVLPNEDPLCAARRELMEETGFESEDWESLGSFVVHGNYGCGNGHFFRARNIKKVALPNSGDLEDMEILLLNPTELLAAIHTGEVATIGTVALIAMATNPSILQPIKSPPAR